MSGRNFGIATGNGEIESGSAGSRELDDAEGAADEVGFSPATQGSGKLLVSQTEHFNVAVFGWAAQKPIAHAATDEISAFKLRRLAEDFRERRWNRVSCWNECWHDSP